MTLTPHIVRQTTLTEEDLRSFSVGTESSPLLFEVPSVPQVQPAPRAPESPRPEPIRPPVTIPIPSPSPIT
jgi:hypothetical protein